jgi:hypothetical protein
MESPSLAATPEGAGATLAHGGLQEKLQVSYGKKTIPKLVIHLHLQGARSAEIDGLITRAVENFHGTESAQHRSQRKRKRAERAHSVAGALSGQAPHSRKSSACSG